MSYMYIHTHTYIYIYMYVCIYPIFRQTHMGPELNVSETLIFKGVP